MSVQLRLIECVKLAEARERVRAATSRAEAKAGLHATANTKHAEECDRIASMYAAVLGEAAKS